MEAAGGIVGREPELTRIARLVDGARSGQSGVLALRGEPGIGKSALLQAARSFAGDDMTVLAAAGSEGESEIPYAALHSLMAPVLDRLGDLPERQRLAVEGALALGPAEAADRLAIGAALIGLLDAAAERMPRLLLVDDAHWLDGATAGALLFAARRLESERIAMLLAIREGEGSHLDLSGIETQRLSGLEAEAAKQLIARSLEREPKPELVDSLLRATAGNPLALIELPRALDPGLLAVREEADEPIALGERLREAFLRRVEDLPADSRAVLLLAAASFSEGLEPIATAAGALDTDLGRLEPAESAGLVEVTSSALRFRHPLVRAAVYHGAPPPERRRAHAALAAAETDPAIRAWHLGAAATGPDEETAKALEQAGVAALARGAHGAAAHAFERAASLTPAGGDRARRLGEAAAQLLVAGSMERAGELAAQARSLATDPGVQAGAEITLSRLEVMGGSLDSAQQLALAAARRLEQVDPERSVATLFEVQTSYTLSGRLQESRAIAERASELAAGGPLEDAAMIMLGTELALAGEFGRGKELMGRWRNLGLQELVAAGPPLFFAMTLCLMWTGDYESALANCGATITASRERGAAAPLQMALGQRSEIHRRLGDWKQARADAAESIRLAEETGQLVQGMYPYVVQLRLEAALGLGDALGRVGEYRAMAEAAHLGSVLAYLSAGELLAALSAGEPDNAVAHGRITRELLEGQGMVDPSVIQWRPDFIEALVRGGVAEEAREETRVFGIQAERTGLPWANGAAGRCRGLIAADGEFAAEFEEALEWHSRGSDPFERARTALAYGERLRRAQQPSEARSICVRPSRSSRRSRRSPGPVAPAASCVPAAARRRPRGSRSRATSPPRSSRWPCS